MILEKYIGEHKNPRFWRDSISIPPVLPELL